MTNDDLPQAQQRRRRLALIIASTTLAATAAGVLLIGGCAAQRAQTQDEVATIDPGEPPAADVSAQPVDPVREEPRAVAEADAPEEAVGSDHVADEGSPSDAPSLAGATRADFVPIDGEEAARRVEAGATLIDVREAHEYAASHAAGAVNIPLEELGLDALDAAGVEGEIVLYCRTGRRSELAHRLLFAAGREDVSTLGPLSSWPGALETAEAPAPE